ncbi:MAG: VCBS repeat-containing protein [Phycisphaerales bacterium]|nr:VCBS repeat-containing protein [Phycisphaerales bacterium]
MSSVILTILFFGIAVAGILTAWLGWRGDRRGRERWCPQCRSDLSGSDSRTCPKCGFSSTLEQDFHALSPRWGVVLAGLCITAAGSLGASFSGLGKAANQMFVPLWQLETREDLGKGWVAEIRRSRDLDRTGLMSRVRLSQGGAVRYEWYGWYASLGAFKRGNLKERWGLGQDIDGDGTADLIIETSDGSSQGGLKSMIFSLENQDGIPRLEPMAVLEGGRFVDVDGDGQPEFLVEDATYQLHLGAFGTSARPTLVFAPDARGYWRFDPEATRNRPMPDDWQEDIAREQSIFEVRGEPQGAAVYSAALELIYRGRRTEADALLQSSFEDPARIDAIDAALAQSPWQAQVQSLVETP